MSVAVETIPGVLQRVCELAECAQPFTTGRRDQRFCCQAHNYRTIRRRYSEKQKAVRALNRGKRRIEAIKAKIAALKAELRELQAAAP